MSLIDFRDCLKDECKISEIDADFIAKFYDKGGRIQVQDFFAELEDPRMKAGTLYKDNF